MYKFKDYPLILCEEDRFANETEQTNNIGIPGIYYCPKFDNFTLRGGQASESFKSLMLVVEPCGT